MYEQYEPDAATIEAARLEHEAKAERNREELRVLSYFWGRADEIPGDIWAVILVFAYSSRESIKPGLALTYFLMKHKQHGKSILTPSFFERVKEYLISYSWNPKFDIEDSIKGEGSLCTRCFKVMKNQKVALLVKKYRGYEQHYCDSCVSKCGILATTRVSGENGVRARYGVRMKDLSKVGIGVAYTSGIGPFYWRCQVLEYAQMIENKKKEALRKRNATIEAKRARNSTREHAAIIAKQKSERLTELTSQEEILRKQGRCYPKRRRISVGYSI